jgi:hypothetical protein
MDNSMSNEHAVYVEETIVTTSEIIASAGEDVSMGSSDIIATVVASNTGEVVTLGGEGVPIQYETIQMDTGEQIHIQTTADGGAIQIQTLGGDISTMQLQPVEGISMEEIGNDVVGLSMPTVSTSNVLGVQTLLHLSHALPEQVTTVVEESLANEMISIAELEEEEEQQEAEEEEELEDEDYEPGKGKEEIFPCGECEETFLEYEKYQEHLSDEHDKDINCDAEEHTWKPYYVIHTGKGKRHIDNYEEFECEKCSFIAESQNAVDEHAAEEHKKPFKPRVQCKECEKSFARKYELATHVKKVHLGIKDQKCPQCDYCSADKGAVTKHLKSVHWDERNYPCPYCEYKSKTHGGIENHVKAVHLKLKDYSCEYCDMAFAQVGQLKSHIQRRHLMEKNYQCSECDFRAINQSLVRRHIKVKHQKIKDFLCNTCGYGSASKKQLESHIEKIHKNKKRRKLKPIFLENGFRLKANL